MGTRADFYVASGDPMNLDLEYLGTISSDGREIGKVEGAQTERQFRIRVQRLLEERRGAKYPKLNSLNTDYVFVWVPGVGIVYREEDEIPFKERWNRETDDGRGIYISLALENEWHAKGIASRTVDEDTGVESDYNIPEWDAEYGFRNVSKIEGIRYVYPDNRLVEGPIILFGGRD